MRRDEDLLCEAFPVPWIITCSEDRAALGFGEPQLIPSILKLFGAQQTCSRGRLPWDAHQSHAGFVTEMLQAGESATWHATDIG